MLLLLWCCIYASLNWVIIGLNNGLFLVWHAAIIYTSIDFSSIKLRGTGFNEKIIKTNQFSLTKLHLKLSVILLRFSSGEMSHRKIRSEVNMLRIYYYLGPGADDVKEWDNTCHLFTHIATWNGGLLAHDCSMSWLYRIIAVACSNPGGIMSKHGGMFGLLDSARPTHLGPCAICRYQSQTHLKLKSRQNLISP